MPSTSAGKADLLESRYAEAVVQIEELLKCFQDVRRLDAIEITTYPGFLQGWELPGLCGTSALCLRLLLPKTFPFSPPRVTVSPAPAQLTWPHLEERGFLCLLPDHASTAHRDPASVVISVLEDAQALIAANLAGDGFEQFEDEFESYWARWANKQVPMCTLCRPSEPSRTVYAWHAKGFVLVAEDMDKLRGWMRNRYDKATAKKVNPQRIPLLWLPRPLRPAEYPRTAGALMTLLNSDSAEQKMLEVLLADKEAEFKTVLLGFQGRRGIGFAGVTIRPPQADRYSGNPLTKGGFRGSPPLSVLIPRYSAGAIDSYVMRRYDASWVHGRDHNPDVSVLTTKLVIVFGSGSLGSSVADLLVKAGIGKITLVDPGVTESENASRHELGINSVGMKKASKLASDLSTRFPHLDIEGIPESCEWFADNLREQLRSADLIVSTLGNWRAESYLNAIGCESESFPPVLYSWTEAHAAAGHAIVVIRGHGCLRCLTDDLGKPRYPVSVWPDGGTLVPVPACGGHFQPYGAVELGYIHSLAAELALDVLLGGVTQSIHRTWLGRRELLGRTGGHWSAEWIARNGDPGAGGAIIEHSFRVDADCPECGAKR